MRRSAQGRRGMYLFQFLRQAAPVEASTWEQASGTTNVYGIGQTERAYGSATAFHTSFVKAGKEVFTWLPEPSSGSTMLRVMAS